MLLPMPGRLRQLLRDELQQSIEEGRDVADLAESVAAASAPGSQVDAGELLGLCHALAARPQRPDFPYFEPSDLAAIRAARTDHLHRPLAPAPSAELDDRIYGAWLGRCAGCMLGKPFEGRPFGEVSGAVRKYLEAAADWPLRDYARDDLAACRAVGIEHLPWPTCHRGQVRHVEPDDDIHYTIMGLEVLERHGAEFTTADVAHWWTHRLPAASVFTAEEAAYRNLLQLGAQWEPQRLTPAEWENVRSWLNPYREWIGAQIRADGWALACPGDLQRAAEFAFRDASLSHVKNGVYGAMYCAAMIAAALTGDDPRAVVSAGLSQIPAKARLAAAIRATIAECAAAEDAPDPLARVHAWLWREFGRYHPIHTINNAAAVTAALLLGGDDFGRVITAAVTCGWDTDCNGATAGCIAGARLGAGGLPATWTAPLHDTLRVDVLGYHPASIRACAARHAAVARRLAGSP